MNSYLIFLRILRLCPIKLLLQIAASLFLSVFVGILELSIFALFLPFIINISSSNQNNYMVISKYIPYLSNASIPSQGLVLSILIILVLIVRSLSTICITTTSAQIGNHLSYLAFTSIFNRDYLDIITIDSSKIIVALTNYTGLAILFVSSWLTLFTSLIISMFFLTLIYLTSSSISILPFVVFVIIYAIILVVFKNRVSKNSGRIESYSQLLVKQLQESFNLTRDIILDDLLLTLSTKFKSSDKKLRVSMAENVVLSILPKFFLESAALLSILVIGILLYQSTNSSSVILASLTGLAYGVQRLLPLIQQLYQSITNMRSHKKSVLTMLDLINTSKIEKNIFRQKSAPLLATSTPGYISGNNRSTELVFENVSFSYPGKPCIISNLSFKIQSSTFTKICGPSGSGKTTVMDICLGLLKPSAGYVKVNNVDINSTYKSSYMMNWRKQLAHVPQYPFIVNSSIRDNIALSTSTVAIDEERMEYSLYVACLDSYVKSLPDGLNFNVGENGSRLSGGQRQRLSIARAIYNNSTFIFMDEATNSLDKETEIDLYSRIKSLPDKPTIILISHTENAGDFCDNEIVL